jgi:acetyltransferase-like isoleucine patch superfamily enzyme
MISALRALAELFARERLRRRCDLVIGEGVRANYRSLLARPPARLSIGTGSMVECRISVDNPRAIICIGRNTFVGNSHLVCAKEIIIGDDVLIAWGCTFVDHNSHSVSWQERQNDVRAWRHGEKDWTHVKMAPITICNKAWIGFNSIILKGVTVGEGAIVGAGSVVTRDVEPYTIVAGNPARAVRKLINAQKVRL